MAFGQGFLVGAAVGAVATLLYTPLEGRDARAILLGPFGWREAEAEPEVAWTPHQADDQAPEGRVDGGVTAS